MYTLILIDACQIVIYRDCTTLYSHQQYMCIPFSLTPLTPLYLYEILSLFVFDSLVSESGILV